MNREAKLILWIGIFLMLMIIFTHWSDLSNILFHSRGSSQLQSPSAQKVGPLPKTPGPPGTVPGPIPRIPVPIPAVPNVGNLFPIVQPGR